MDAIILATIIPVLQANIIAKIKSQATEVHTTAEAQTIVEAVVIPIFIIIKIGAVIREPGTKERIDKQVGSHIDVVAGS